MQQQNRPAMPPQPLSINSSADSNPRPLKRRRRNLIPESPTYEDTMKVLPEETVAGLLNKSTAMILKSVGFSGATVVAQERLRQLAEDYYLQMLNSIHQLARAQRRTRPTAIDFEEMLLHSNIPLSALETELHRCHSDTPIPTTLQKPSPPPPPLPDLSELLGPELDGSNDKIGGFYDHLPPLPSKHTYMDTPVFTERTTDPRMIRERATEEARLAENALRKLLAVSAANKDLGDMVDGKKKVVSKKRKERDDEWRRAYDELEAEGRVKVNGVASHGGRGGIFGGGSDNGGGGGSGGGRINKGKGKEKQGDVDAGYLEVIVNADNQFWRKATNRRRKPNPSATSGITA